MTTSTAPEPFAARLDELVASLTLDEKASLTAGRDVWHLPALTRQGIGAFKMSDGPSGVRGERIGTRRSLSFPCGMAAGATWDVELIGRYGRALGDEARSKGVHLLLGPTVCIPRTPLAGRTFESFAEDPHLSARLTVAYVRGVQERGVGCCVKHFACNDQEHERMTISAEVDERTLREVHLPSFEAAVVEAGVWSVMSAYNRVNGTYCGEHPDLLGRILKGEWGFDGVVVSDWLGTHSTVEATVNGLDIEMPGPGSFLGPKLAAAVASGDVDPAVVDDHARRIVRLFHRCGLLDTPDTAHVEEAEDDDPGRRQVAHELAVASTVLLHNENALPLAPGVRRVAVVGPNASGLETGGGGSASVTPFRQPSLLDALRGLMPDTDVVYEEGCRLDHAVPRIDERLLDDGMTLEYFAGPGIAGEPAAIERIWRGELTVEGDPAPDVSGRDFSARATARFTPDANGTWQLGIANAGGARLLLDSGVIVDNLRPVPGSTFYGLGSDVVATDVELDAGHTYQLVVEFHASGLPFGGFRVCAGRPPVPDALDRAVEAARTSDVAVVVVGASSESETEGADRPDLRLIGDQDELVNRVAAANPNTVVVVNAGAPVEMPWVEDVAAVLVVWYPGEEGASALAEVLTGAAEPGGRSPVTFPARLTDTAPSVGPDGSWYPGVDGKVTYGEGLLVGYRHLDANAIEPMFGFGHGLSYTTFEYSAPIVDGEAPDVTVHVPVTNTGDRAGTEVVQVYVGAVDRQPDRPVRQLAGFAKVDVDAGETVTVTAPVDVRSFSAWDEEAGRWVVLPGEYELSVGSSSRALHHRVSITVDAT